MATDDEKTLENALLATEIDEILLTVWRHLQEDNTDPPTLDDLLEISRAESTPHETIKDANRRLAALYPDVVPTPTFLRDERNNDQLTAVVDSKIFYTVEQCHAEWARQKREGGEVKHPLLPLMNAYSPPLHAEPETRPTAILPEPLRTARISAYSGGGDLALPLKLPRGKVGEVGPTQSQLIQFESKSKSVVPELPLHFHRDEKRLTNHKGRGAPPALRLWWSALAHTPAAVRQRDGSVRLKTTLRELNHWLYPGQRWYSRRLPIVARSLWQADGIFVTHERRDWRLVAVDALPTLTTKLDDPLPIRVQLPPGSQRGALIDIEMMTHAGTISGPVFNASIRLAYVWDEAKGKNGGHRIYATRPAVLRNRKGHIVDSQNQPILGPDPMLPKIERSKVPSDRPATNWNDSRAVHLDHDERNPAADKVPALDRADLLRLFYGDEPLPSTKDKMRRKVSDAKSLLERHFEEPGHVVLEELLTEGGYFQAVRILQKRPPDKNWLGDS